MTRAPDFFVSKDDRERHARENYDRHFLEEGRRYTFELSKTWMRGYGITDRVEAWYVFIKQAECPWAICACERFEYRPFVPGARQVAKTRAEKWGRDYLKRGCPPEGFFDPPPADSNERVFRR